MMHWVDEAVGNISLSLKRYGMWEDTLLVVSSDNGGLSCEYFDDDGDERQCSAPCTAQQASPPPMFDGETGGGGSSGCEADRTHPDVQIDYNFRSDSNPGLPAALNAEVSAASNAPLRGRKHQAFEGGASTIISSLPLLLDSKVFKQCCVLYGTRWEQGFASKPSSQED
jgi:arylsulfatase A-like enzyme